MKFLASLLLCSPLLAQTFQIVPSTAPHGGGGSLLVTFSSPAGKEPVALQWKIDLGSELTATAQDIVAGGAATAAEKAITCAPAKSIADQGVAYKCILAGGLKNIANGTVFLVKYGIKATTIPQVLRVRISEALGVSQHQDQSNKLEILPAEGTITAR